MSEKWSDEELRVAVDAYVDMLHKQRSGLSFVKKHYYANLHARFGRTEKSFEYRMQNISYVLSLMGRTWLSGLKPAKNVGAKNAERIEILLAQAEGIKTLPTAAFEIAVQEEVHKPLLPKPSGCSVPKSILTEVSTYQRSCEVKAWVLKEAKGICEGCGQAAPFNRVDGMPYLEVHHLRQLAEGGSDTIQNTVALCPNCHREIHYGMHKDRIAKELYARLARLVSE